MSSPNKRRPPSRTWYAEIVIAAWTGAISATHLCDPAHPGCHGSTSGIWSPAHALPNLAEGGYVIDLRPLADHPQVSAWVFQSPLSNGQIDGEEIARLPTEVREAARDLAPGMAGDFQRIAEAMAARAGEPPDRTAGPFDAVSAASRAAYWAARGARIGRRTGGWLIWSDGARQPIETETPQKTA